MSNIEGAFSIDDIAIEILSRLSVKDLSAGKCVSKRWYDIISSPLFLHAHSERSTAISGLLYHFYDVVNHHPFDMGDVSLKTFLDFFPEEVQLMGSSNGLVCFCSSVITRNSTLGKRLQNRVTTNKKVIFPEELVIYICNPTSRKCISLRPKRCDIGDSIGIAFFPFGSSGNNFPVYRLVSIQESETKPNHYSFTVYFSETNIWRKSKEICHCKFVVYTFKTISIGERFFWFTENRHIVAFDVETELSYVIKLPDPVLEGHHGVRRCLGSSDGYLHYVLVNCSEIAVWTLTDYLKPEWVLKHQLSMLEFYESIKNKISLEGFGRVILRAQRLNDTCHFNALNPVVFHEDVLYVELVSWVCSYRWKTNELSVICLNPENGRIPFSRHIYPYTDSLVAANLFNGLG